MTWTELYDCAYGLCVKHSRHETMLDLQYLNESGLQSIISLLLPLEFS